MMVPTPGFEIASLQVVNSSQISINGVTGFHVGGMSRSHANEIARFGRIPPVDTKSVIRAPMPLIGTSQTNS